MASVRQKKQGETPIGDSGLTEEEAERIAEEIEHDEFELVDGMWIIPIGPDSGHDGETSSDWAESISVTPADLEKLQDEADVRQISVRALLERRIAEGRSE